METSNNQQVFSCTETWVEWKEILDVHQSCTTAATWAAKLLPPQQQTLTERRDPKLTANHPLWHHREQAPSCNLIGRQALWLQEPGSANYRALPSADLIIASLALTRKSMVAIGDSLFLFVGDSVAVTLLVLLWFFSEERVWFLNFCKQGTLENRTHRVHPTGTIQVTSATGDSDIWPSRSSYVFPPNAHWDRNVSQMLASAAWWFKDNKMLSSTQTFTLRLTPCHKSDVGGL